MNNPLILSSLKLIIDIMPVVIPIVIVVLLLSAVYCAFSIRRKLRSHKKYIYTLEQSGKTEVLKEAIIF